MLDEITRNKLVTQLDELSDDDLLCIYTSAMQWDGSFDFVDTMDIYEAVECMKRDDIVNTIVYGNVTNVMDPVRFDGYGNLESVSEYDLMKECRDELDELAEWLLDNHNHADLDFYDGDAIQHTILVWDRTYEPEEDVCEAIAAMVKG